MGLLNKVFGREHADTAAASSVNDTAACSHGTMLARWDSVEDMGDESKATSFVCQSCNEEFTPEQAEAVRQAASERLSRDLSERQ